VGGAVLYKSACLLGCTPLSPPNMAAGPRAAYGLLLLLPLLPLSQVGRVARGVQVYRAGLGSATPLPGSPLSPQVALGSAEDDSCDPSNQ
jgi:hypothetical protein